MGSHYGYSPYLWPLLAAAGLFAALAVYGAGRRSVPGALSSAVATVFAVPFVGGSVLADAATHSSTRHRPGLEVLEGRSEWWDGQSVPITRPDLVVVAISQATLRLLSDLLSRHPGLLLVGVGVTSNELLVLSGHPAGVLTTEQLVKIIGQAGWPLLAAAGKCGADRVPYPPTQENQNDWSTSNSDRD